MIDFITFEEARSIITDKDAFGNPIPFDVEFVTANQKTGKAGKVINLKNVVNLFERRKDAQKKKTYHFMNGTLNVKPAGGDGRPTKIHSLLIRRINGKTVAL